MKNQKLWETIGYITLALCIIGNVTVGNFYLFAQFAYLIANGIAVVRSFILERPTADKVKDITFFAITVALIIMRIF